MSFAFCEPFLQPYSFSLLLNILCVLGTILGIKDTVLNKQNFLPLWIGKFQLVVSILFTG
jgi:hypothetical protein